MTNRFMEEYWSTIEGTHGMRTGLLDTLSDADLAFTPGGINMTLGELCKELGEIEYSYIESIKTFKQDWSYRNPEPGLANSVTKLKAWYQTLDSDMKATVSAMTDDDLKKTVDRGYPFTVDVQLQIYLQALLIFFGKATVFIKAMNRPLSQQLQDWIG
ncbi:MAG TPA: DinB family protein [Phototrophicaceae bacterium]|nr:DinB family protein [Phototrophicaceae bacterium]